MNKQQISQLIDQVDSSYAEEAAMCFISPKSCSKSSALVLILLSLVCISVFVILPGMRKTDTDKYGISKLVPIEVYSEEILSVVPKESDMVPLNQEDVSRFLSGNDSLCPAQDQEHRYFWAEQDASGVKNVFLNWSFGSDYSKHYFNSVFSFIPDTVHAYRDVYLRTFHENVRTIGNYQVCLIQDQNEVLHLFMFSGDQMISLTCRRQDKGLLGPAVRMLVDDGIKRDALE
ncbi:MAG: hypothetical protein IJM39_00840 [Firmicutes bacterium]|nr:hypothetical protein [Bacillota bacterium]